MQHISDEYRLFINAVTEFEETKELMEAKTGKKYECDWKHYTKQSEEFNHFQFSDEQSYRRFQYQSPDEYIEWLTGYSDWEFDEEELAEERKLFEKAQRDFDDVLDFLEEYLKELKEYEDEL